MLSLRPGHGQRNEEYHEILGEGHPMLIVGDDGHLDLSRKKQKDLKSLGIKGMVKNVSLRSRMVK